jgi:riboflavin synthase
MATVKSFKGSKLSINAKHTPKIGDSIAINGACLTVIELFKDGFAVVLSPESTAHLAIENYKNKVHIEPAMMIQDRLEGHIVQGHIDCIGTIKQISQNQNSTDFFISIPKNFIKFVVPKGSIAIDGVSLTVNDVLDDNFRLTIIPHTIENTLFKTYKVGSRVNIETDLFARYIYNILNANKTSQSSWDEIDKVMANY